MTNVVVTGIGLVTALGADRESTWSAIREGKRGFAPLRLFDLPGRPAPVVAEVRAPALPAGLARRALLGSSRTDRLALAAASEAVRDAGIDERALAGAAVVLGA